MAELPSNPVPFEVLEDSETPHRVGLELTVYAADDPFTPLDVIPRRTQLKALDEIGGPGGGSFRVFRNDEKLSETPALLDYDNIFKIALDGKVVGAFIKGAETTDFLNQDERSGEYIESSGEGLRGWLHGAVVEPYGGIRSDSQDTRVFSFASEQGSWYQAEDWVTPVVIQNYNMDPNPGPFGTAPADWPDAPAAKWIWGEANDGTTNPATEGLNFFRYEFELSGLSGAENFSVFAAAKDHFQVFMDGQQIIEAKEDDAYSKTWRADLQLTNGSHVLAVKVLSQGTGAAAMIAALFKAGDATAGTEATLLKVTDTTDWKVNAYPDPAPGWTPGEIMLTLLEEAEARGVLFPTYLSPTFTATHDSDGAEWTRALDWSFDIGTEYIDVVEKLEELVCDLWIDPANYEMHLYAERGAHKDVQSAAVEPVKFEIAKNVTRAQAEGTSEIKNALLMRTEDGWQSITDSLSDSISKYGRREGFVSSGASAAVSGDLAQRIFTRKSKPSVSATYDVIDVDGARPFFDFNAGDWVLAPSEQDEYLLVPRRAMSLSVSENDSTGLPVFAIEFDTIAQDLARRFDRWLKTTSDGTLGGTLANVSGGGGGGGGATPSGQTVRSGPTGQTGPRGLPGFNNRSVWDDAQVYQISDAVSWEGDWWVANAETNEEPGPSASDWDLLEVAPSTTPAVGATLYLTGNFSAPSAATALPWTGERYKSNITHESNSANLVIQDAGPYLISGKFAINANAIREYAVQVNGVTVVTANSYPVNYASTRGVADLDSVLINLAVGDVVRIVTSGAATHSVQASTDTWISVAKITGAKGDQGPEGDPGQGFTWEDTWATATAYEPYDVVFEDGSSYVCILGHTSGSTTQPGVGASWETNWSLLAQRGGQGVPGDEGPPGQSFILQGTWDSGTAYAIGDMVYYDTTFWVALEANTNQEPGVEPEWAEYAGSGGGTGTRATVTYTTASLAVDAEEAGTITLAPSFQIMRVSADRACRIRLYATGAYSTADADRDMLTDPVGDHGLILEFVTEADFLEAALSPIVLGSSLETSPSSAIPIRVQNLGEDTGTVSVTLTWMQTE